MLLQELRDKKLIHPPDWLPCNTHYLALVGSMAYGANSDTSDCDLYGFCTPKKDMIFPHLAGEIPGFGTPGSRFEQWQEHHVFDQDAMAGKGRSYDFQVFSIVKFFDLAMKNNPTMLDALFTPQECVWHMTAVGNMVREGRRLFLNKGCYFRFKGYALAQAHKMKTKDPTGKRAEIREKYGFDLKFAFHVVRLLLECEDILTTGDLDLRKNKEHLKAVRRGDLGEQEIMAWAGEKEKQLEKMYIECKILPEKPDEAALKRLLLNCLEHHFGSLEKCLAIPDRYEQALREVRQVLDRAGL